MCQRLLALGAGTCPAVLSIQVADEKTQYAQLLIQILNELLIGRYVA
jgi:hypothetical protein